MEDRFEISFSEGGVSALETIITGGLANAVEKGLDTVTGNDDHGWYCTIEDRITELKVTCWGPTKEKAQEKALTEIWKEIEDFEHEQVKEEEEREQEEERKRIQFEEEQSERRRFSNVSNNDSSSSSEVIIKITAWIVGICLAVFVVIWLAINVVIPVAMLNSSLIFAILTFVFKKNKTLFASLALVGGAYLIIDVTNGWLSLLFVENVVKSHYWISAFVYINAAAIGLCTWLLVQPLWRKAKLIGISNRRNGIILKIISIFLVVISLSAAPIIYIFVPNQFAQQVYSKSDISSRIENSVPISTPQNIEEIRTLPNDTNINQESTENSIPTNTPKIQYGSLTDIDGNEYNTITIGTQVWMAENLKTTKYNDGSSIPNVTNDDKWAELKTDAYCDYDNTASNSIIYGRLYNWFAVNTGKLCPIGWHVPTDAEWTILTASLSGNPEDAKFSEQAGTAYWNSTNENAINNSGFTVLPGGQRFYNGTFHDIGSIGYWWSSTEQSESYIWSRRMQFSDNRVNRPTSSKEDGFSVRCIKD